MSQVDSKRELVTVSELAAYLKCTPDALYTMFRREGAGEAQGIRRPFRGKRGIRIDLKTFLRWRDETEPPARVTGHAEPSGVVKEVLGVLMPMQTQVAQLLNLIGASIERLHELYEGEDEDQHDGSDHTSHR